MNRELLCRGAGVLAIVAGVALAYWGVLETLEMARNGVPEISYRMKTAFGVPLILIGGIAYVIGGAKFDTLTHNPENGRFTKWGLLMALPMLGLEGLLYWWMTQQFEALGYIQA